MRCHTAGDRKCGREWGKRLVAEILPRPVILKITPINCCICVQRSLLRRPHGLPGSSRLPTTPSPTWAWRPSSTRHSTLPASTRRRSKLHCQVSMICVEITQFSTCFFFNYEHCWILRRERPLQLTLSVLLSVCFHVCMYACPPCMYVCMYSMSDMLVGMYVGSACWVPIASNILYWISRFYTLNT